MNVNNLDFKLIVSLVAVALTAYGYLPYFRDIFRNKTKPHLYTWLVWTITQGTATAVIWNGGGNYAVFSLGVGTILVGLVFLFALKYGTRNITRSDTVVLIAALLAIVVWWKLESPLLAVVMISIIDGLGFVPTFRKSFEEPWSETLSFWIIMALINALVIVSIEVYGLVTIIYPVTLLIANMGVWGICFFRRKLIPIPTI